MDPKGTPRRTARGAGGPTIASSLIDASDVTARLLLPTSAQGPWQPFERFAETVATSRKKAGLHPHQAQEVVTYVLEGYVDHTDDAGHQDALTAGSVIVLTAHEPVQHELRMQKGRTARWLSIVMRLAWHTEPLPTSLLVRTASGPIEAPDGTIRRPVVGASAHADSPNGFELLDIEFSREGTGFFRIGRDRRAIAYVLHGSGTIDNERALAGQAALVEDASGVQIQGSSGYRVALASIRRPSE